MPHETALVATVAAGLGLAFVFGFLAARLRVPPLVGYLLAGVAVGPFSPGFVADTNLAGQLAEIGVILLMFGVGLHFSFPDLLAVRKIALPGAAAQIAVATALGAVVAHFWNWSWGAALVFGFSLSVASTVVLLRALEERGLLDSSEGRIAVGWLIVEDLAMVLALVLLPAIAAPAAGTGHSASTGSLALVIALTLGKVAVFVAFMHLIGRRAVPWLLAQVARVGSRELFTLGILAVALGIALGAAALFGVSFALGAFFAGVVISESDLSHRVASDALPLQDAFAVLFFVSVGMLLDPAVLVQRPLQVLLVLLIIVVGKAVAAFGIVLAFRHPVRTALTISASLAQIGEFSFILVALGISLHLLPVEARDLVLAGAILSITLNPLLFSAIEPLARWLNARPRLLEALERPRSPWALEPPSREHAGARRSRGHRRLRPGGGNDRRCAGQGRDPAGGRGAGSRRPSRRSGGEGIFAILRRRHAARDPGACLAPDGTASGRGGAQSVRGPADHRARPRPQSRDRHRGPHAQRGRADLPGRAEGRPRLHRRA